MGGFTTHAQGPRSLSRLRDTHVGSSSNNDTQGGPATLNANNAPTNRNRNIGGHGMLLNLPCYTPSKALRKAKHEAHNRSVPLVGEHLELRA